MHAKKPQHNSEQGDRLSFISNGGNESGAGGSDKGTQSREQTTGERGEERKSRCLTSTVKREAGSRGKLSTQELNVCKTEGQKEKRKIGCTKSLRL